MFNINTTVQLKSSLLGNTRVVPFRACGKVTAVYETVYKVKFPQGNFDVPVDQLELAQKHTCTPENVPQFKEWLQRGGLAIWNSANLSNPSKTWTCPLYGKDGNLKEKPSWEAGEITRIIKDSAEVVVEIPKEVRRFHVAIRRGSQGMSFKLTDGSTNKLHKIIEKVSKEYNKDAWYEFDYSSQEAVIYIAESETPINEWSASPVSKNSVAN